MWLFILIVLWLSRRGIYRFLFSLTHAMRPWLGWGRRPWMGPPHDGFGPHGGFGPRGWF